MRILEGMVNKRSTVVTKHITIAAFYVLLLTWGCQVASGQLREGPIQIFGYYQNAFEYYAVQGHGDHTSFMTQQLNLIGQKDLAPRFRSFVNFEFLNTYDGSLGWGSASLKEAWVRYDAGRRFKLKLGLQIPVFNGLNEIKTRSPLLPYIVRPIVYETSLKEIVNIEEYVPEQAFIQAYGVLPAANLNVEYALFVGNSPNVNNNPEQGQTGIDTTTVIMVGGRLGLHQNNFDSDFSEIKLGVSSTYDRVNSFTAVPELITPDPDAQARISDSFEEIPRWRLGTDVSIYWKKLYLQAEYITARNREPSRQLSIDRIFYYATLGAIPNEKSEFYLTYWATREKALVENQQVSPGFFLDQIADLDIYGAGVKYALWPRVVLKAQFARVNVHLREDITRGEAGIQRTAFTEENNVFTVYALAVSVFF